MNGELCVMTSGIILMLLLCVENLDTQLQVTNFACGYTYMKLLLISSDGVLVLLVLFYMCKLADAVAFSNAHFGRGAGPIYLDNIDCSGSESNLFNCSNSSVVNCASGHWDDAGVRCQGRFISACTCYVDYHVVKNITTLLESIVTNATRMSANTANRQVVFYSTQYCIYKQGYSYSQSTNLFYILCVDIPWRNQDCLSLWSRPKQAADYILLWLLWLRRAIPFCQ